MGIETSPKLIIPFQTVVAIYKPPEETRPPFGTPESTKSRITHAVMAVVRSIAGQPSSPLTASSRIVFASVSSRCSDAATGFRLAECLLALTGIARFNLPIHGVNTGLPRLELDRMRYRTRADACAWKI